MNHWETESSLRELGLRENRNLVSESLGNRIITGKQGLRESGNPDLRKKGSRVNGSLIGRLTGKTGVWRVPDILGI